MLTDQENSNRRRRSAGHAVIELSLLMPWLFFLFVGALDFGFYAYGLISVQNATRIAALNAGFSATDSVSQAEACFHARRELASMPYAQSFPSACDQSPLVVSVTPHTDAEGMAASRVRVTYDGAPLIPIPGMLSGTMRIDRSVDVRVYGE